MAVTGKQWLQICSSVVSGFITGAALFTTLLGPDLTPKVIAALGIINIVINSVGANLSSQANIIRDVAAMPGVDQVKVNAQANQILAQAAVSNDPALAKIEPTAAAESRVAAIAKGAA